MLPGQACTLEGRPLALSVEPQRVDGRRVYRVMSRPVSLAELDNALFATRWIGIEPLIVK